MGHTQVGFGGTLQASHVRQAQTKAAGGVGMHHKMNSEVPPGYAGKDLPAKISIGNSDAFSVNFDQSTRASKKNSKGGQQVNKSATQKIDSHTRNVPVSIKTTNNAQQSGHHR